MVVAEQPGQLILEVGPLRVVGKQVAQWHDHRWIRCEARHTVDEAGEAAERAEVVPRPGLGEGAVDPLAAAPADILEIPGSEFVDVGLDVPHLEGGHLREAAHRPAIAAADRLNGGRPITVTESAVAAGDLDTGSKPLDVPFPRTAQRLVEVVQVEDQAPLGRSEEPEVRQVRVSAELNDGPGHGCFGEVGRHHGRGSAEERER